MAIGASVGVKENVFNGNVVISPNPTNGVLNISFSSIPENTQMEMYNSIGALVMVETLNAKNNMIAINDFSNGIYFIKIFVDHKIVTVKKVVKQ